MQVQKYCSSIVYNSFETVKNYKQSEASNRDVTIIICTSTNTQLG